MSKDPQQDQAAQTPTGDSWLSPKEFASLGAALFEEVCFEMQLFDVASFWTPAAARNSVII